MDSGIAEGEGAAVTRPPRFRYTSDVEDSARWDGFGFRSGDIVISTRSKSGTTWLQMVCALLVYQQPILPAPLAEISPWLDWLVEPLDEVTGRLDAQTRRRIIKTHTPLDGLPIDPRATYLVMTREPLDMAVSLYHQGANLDRARVAALTGRPPPQRARSTRPDLHSWLLEWIHEDCDPRQTLDSLPGVIWHAADAWSRRRQPNVVLLRYEDFLSDLDPQMRSLAGLLDCPTDGTNWADLVAAASFDHMQARAADLAPDPKDVLQDKGRFFRRGSSGAGRETLDDDEYESYVDRLHQLGSAELVGWIRGAS